MVDESKHGQKPEKSVKVGAEHPVAEGMAPPVEGAVVAGIPPSEAAALFAEIPEKGVEEVMRVAAAALGGPLAASNSSDVKANDSDITDELEKGGPAFGAFLKGVGLAVADTQTALDQTLVSTAEALSKTQIDVIAVFEQVINDDGGMEKGEVHIQKLPLVNYLMPTAYQFSRVYLTADMSVSEFNAANGFNIKSTSASVQANASYSMFGGFSGGISGGVSHTDVSGGTSTSVDTAAGKLHMEATLEPRHDIELPRPFIIQKGPKLRLLIGSRDDIVEQVTDPADSSKTVNKVTGRKVTLTAELNGTNGGPLEGKLLQVSCDNPVLSYTASGTTAANGRVIITVERKGAAFDPATILNATVRVWLNLVSSSMPITL
jgi:hypothetical protein